MCVCVCVCVCVKSHFLHPSFDSCWSCFYIVATLNNAAVNMGMQRSLWDSDYNSFWYILRSRFVGSYDSSIFNFWGLFITVFHNGCTNLYSHQQCIGLPFSPHHCQYLLSFDILIITVLAGVRWYLIVILIFVIDDCCVDCFFMCLLAICIYSLENIYSHPLPILN